MDIESLKLYVEDLSVTDFIGLKAECLTSIINDIK